MSYVDPNYSTKKAFKDAIAAGKVHHPYNPSGMFEPPRNGTDVIEGPHYPKPHRWYASVVITDGVVTKCEGVKLGSAVQTLGGQTLAG